MHLHIYESIKGSFTAYKLVEALRYFFLEKNENPKTHIHKQSGRCA